ncbi:MAG: STAS domain-containing protein [Candidatus Promineifilaceae bacterium]|nr:STAS domain-containing protein [Candidatus Promineifilaceae bacterium]
MLRTPRLFAASVRFHDAAPAVAIVDLQGEINAFAEEMLNDAYAEADAHNPSAILLNFGDVDYINSTGIALIVALLARARKAHRHLMTCGLGEHYEEIFRITRLADFMTVHRDEASALHTPVP